MEDDEWKWEYNANCMHYFMRNSSSYVKRIMEESFEDQGPDLID